MNHNSCLVNINNCNSLNSSVVSSTIVNSIRRNSFYKLTNVLLLLFLVFGSCVVSFGADENVNDDEEKENKIPTLGPRDRYACVPSIIQKISMFVLKTIIYKEVESYKNDFESKCWQLFTVGIFEHNLHYGTTIPPNKNDVQYTTYNNEILISYFIGNILAHSLYRGLFSVKSCLKIIKEGGNWELYLGIGNVPYVGGLFNLSLVCKPTLLTFLQNKVTIHIIDIKPFNFILGCVFSTLLIWYTECKKLYIRPQWILGFGTVEINIAKYYNISLNVGSWIVDLITFMKYTKEANELLGGEKH